MHERITTVQYNPDFEALTRKKRVCAYARVSSDRDEAFHSLSAQIGYYQKMIAENSDWEYAGVFSDRGITGTKEERPGFQAMLEACREGKVDIVLAKSITRFARNTVILLNTVRELRSLGIDIHFEEERIETLSEKGEFMISILAARAQEESRQASENRKWQIQKSFEKGIPVSGNCFGYRMVDHHFLIDEEEEPIVLRIFSMYLSGMGTGAIAKKLTQEGIKTRFGKANWSASVIYSIIRNEKYTGDLILQKWFVKDHISKLSVKNRGEKRKYIVVDAHDPIISKDTFEKVQAEISRRSAFMGSAAESQRYPFTKLITCGKCGHHYKHKFVGSGTKYRRSAWMCQMFDFYGSSYCDSQQIPTDILIEKTCEVLGITDFDEAALRERIKEIIVPEKNTLVYKFKDGTEKQVNWQHRSRRESWTPEMKEAARKKAKEQWVAKKQLEEADDDA